MLILTRRLDQAITFGDPSGPEPPTEITIIGMRGDQIRIGITAPRGVLVDRKEVWLQKRQAAALK